MDTPCGAFRILSLLIWNRLIISIPYVKMLESWKTYLKNEILSQVRIMGFMVTFIVEFVAL